MVRWCQAGADVEDQNMLQRLKDSLPAKTIKAYGDSKAGNFGAGLAFNAFLTMFPLLLGILSVIGLVIQDPAMQVKFQTALVGIFPQDAHKQLLQALGGVKQHAGLLGIISIVGLIWSGTGLFASMEFALTQIFGTRSGSDRRTAGSMGQRQRSGVPIPVALCMSLGAWFVGMLVGRSRARGTN